jgi:hypothetical protein
MAQEATKRLAAEGKAHKLANLMIETGIVGTGPANDGLARTGGQAAGARSSTVGLRQSRLSPLPQMFLETLDTTS